MKDTIVAITGALIAIVLVGLVLLGKHS